MDPDNVSVPPLIAEVCRTGVDQRVCAAAIGRFVDLAAIAIEAAVDGVPVAAGIGERQEALRWNAGGDTPARANVRGVERLTRLHAGDGQRRVCGVKLHVCRLYAPGAQRLLPCRTAI